MSASQCAEAEQSQLLRITMIGCPAMFAEGLCGPQHALSGANLMGPLPQDMQLLMLALSWLLPCPGCRDTQENKLGVDAGGN